MTPTELAIHRDLEYLRAAGVVASMRRGRAKKRETRLAARARATKRWAKFREAAK